ncbi:hypothetical protein V8G54_003079 [Vigna mungo]|uniref:RNA-directed DNA polymerase n=1 Tax=Vigna mungo TaxID=3915 RepID=A0AAQ3PBF9_VIGMU
MIGCIYERNANKSSSSDTTNISKLLEQILFAQANFANTLHNISSRTSALESHSSSNPPPHPSTRPIKFNLPTFDGSDALGWIFKVTQFFEFHQTPIDQRIQVALFYLVGPALAWFQWMFNNGLLTSWEAFLHALELRYAPSKFEDPIAAICKLTQTNTLPKYLAEFETLANRISDLPQSFYLSCFTSGLKPHIRREILALQPADLPHAIALAKLQDDKNRTTPFPSSCFARPSPPSPQPQIPAPKPLPPLLPTPPTKLPIKRLTEAEMQARRDKNLCYNCDERYTRRHRCKPQFLLLTTADTDDPSKELVELDSDSTIDPPLEAGLISLHALSGQWNPRTFQVTGSINGYNVQILVDSGATHNFIQTHVAQFLQLPLEPITSPLQVMVGNGDFLPCSTFCSQAQLTLADHTFPIDLYPLELSGTDVVLGVHWLSLVSPIVMDYNAPFMRFMWQGKLVQLQGDTGPSPSPISVHQLRRLQHTNMIAALFQLSLNTTTSTSSISFNVIPLQPPQNTHSPIPPTSEPRLTALLHRYSTFFSTPMSLPPSRHNDLSITLLPNTSPISIRHIVIHIFRNKKLRSRALNAATMKDKFPIPTVDELLDELGHASWFSKLDLFSGFHQILMNPKDASKTAFRTHNGHFEFRVTPFGLCNAPSTFQSAMNELFRPHLRRFIIVFFDDILVYSPTLETHITHLETTFHLLLSNSFYLKGSKCFIGQHTIHYLGHVVSNHGVQPDPDKLQAIRDWPVPTSTKALRGFLGLTGFYRRFVPGYAKIANALTDLLRKDAFLWNDQAQQAFDQLKLHFLALTVSLPFKLMPPAPVWVQFCHKTVIRSHFSKQIFPKLRHSSTYIRELCAITSAVQKWRQYLLRRHFIIQTDQRSIKELLSQTVLTPEQQSYLFKLLGYDFEIQYRPGKSNTAVDALSQVESPHLDTFLVLSVPRLDFLNDLKQSLSSNSDFTAMRDNILAKPSDFPLYSVHGELITFKEKIWLPSSCALIPLLLQEYHSSPMAGHTGVTRTLGRLMANFYWPSIRKDVQSFISQCVTCQQTKIPAQKPSGLLQPIPPPSQCWEDLSLDFIVGLPAYKGYTTILVVVDRFSKAAHFRMLPRSFSATQVADVFVNIVCKHHGLPCSLISDHDLIFLSQFWRDLFKLSGTKLRMSTAYHPQSDEQTEVANKVLQQYLRCFVQHRPSLWGKFLAWAEWSFNTTINASTGLSPFEVMFRRKPPAIPFDSIECTSNAVVQSELTTRADILQKLERNLTKAQASMKKWTDTNRKDIQFNVGDYVYVRLCPRRQASVAGPYITKLQKNFFGPFKVTNKLGAVAYELELPPSARIHNVFHVSFLRPHKGHLPTSPLQLPPEIDEHQPILEPAAILDRKWDSSTPDPQIQVLIQWLGLPLEEATWEPWSSKRQPQQPQHFKDYVVTLPHACAKGKTVRND